VALPGDGMTATADPVAWTCNGCRNLHYMQEPIHPGGVCQRCADRYRGALDAAAELDRVWPGLQGDRDE